MSKHSQEAYLKEVRDGIAIVSLLISMALSLLLIGLGANFAIALAVQIVSFLVILIALFIRLERMLNE